MIKLNFKAAPMAALFLFGAALTGCSSNPDVPVVRACSCADYFPSTPRPAWVDSPASTAEYIYATGLTSCNAIKSIDIESADKQARANLATNIMVNIKTVITTKDRSYDGVNSSTYIQDSEIASKLQLNSAEIYDHWVDPITCTVYSAARYPQSLKDKAITDYHESVAKKIINQSFKVQYLSKELNEVPGVLENYLTTAGVAKFEKNGRLSLSAKISKIDKQEKSVVVSILLAIKDQKTGRELWKKTINGKGATFKASTSKSVLQKKAIQDAFKAANRDLTDFIKQSSL